jgi:hypothetical protein
VESPTHLEFLSAPVVVNRVSIHRKKRIWKKRMESNAKEDPAMVLI